MCVCGWVGVVRVNAVIPTAVEHCDSDYNKFVSI